MSYSDDAEYQHKVSQYVSDHVYYCLSELVSEVAPKFFEGVFPEYNEETAHELFRTTPDQDDCINAGFQFFQKGDYWYYTDCSDNVEPEAIGDFCLEELVAFAADEGHVCYDPEDDEDAEDQLQDALAGLEEDGFKITHRGGSYCVEKPFDVSGLDEFDTEDEAVENCIRYNDIEGAEVYEHWLVSSHLAYKLKQHGQTVVDDFFGLTVWCRTCTGQAISMDYVINEIYKEVHAHEED